MRKKRKRLYNAKINVFESILGNTNIDRQYSNVECQGVSEQIQALEGTGACLIEE